MCGRGKQLIFPNSQNEVWLFETAHTLLPDANTWKMRDLREHNINDSEVEKLFVPGTLKQVVKNERLGKSLGWKINI